jgi:hypothetical protein
MNLLRGKKYEQMRKFLRYRGRTRSNWHRHRQQFLRRRSLKDLFLRPRELRGQGEEWMIACWMIDEAKVKIGVRLEKKEGELEQSLGVQ